MRLNIRSSLCKIISLRTKFDDTTLIISAPPDSTPGVQLTFKPSTRQTEITFANTYGPTDLLSVTALGPTLINDISVNYSWSTAQIQTIVSPGPVLAFQLTNNLQYTNPDNLIVTVNGIRANFGALQNRLVSTSQNLLVVDENMSAANSRIRDADIAAESAEMTRNNILLQAGISVLGQANNAQQMALKLLS
jgi:flagellin-like hook-associated protein FlgL